MTQRKAANGLDFDALRLGIERRDPDLVLGFYTEDAQLRHSSYAEPKTLSSRRASCARQLRRYPMAPCTCTRVSGTEYPKRASAATRTTRLRSSTIILEVRPVR
jgi:hypothetical protein